jgi:UDP-GlcNAc3NAcA epimerase
MNRFKILTVVGARPQFIKAAALSRALSRRGITEIMVHTGQHFEHGMSGVFFAELDIPAPDHHLGINGGGHGDMTGRMLQCLEPVMLKEKPDLVVVYGDTNSTVAGALCAAKLHIPIAHVEAGLRSFDRRMSEEVNRVISDHLSDLLLCPTRAAVANLAAEGIVRGVHHVGDVMYDAALHAATEAKSRSNILERLGLRTGGYAVATVHRAENTDRPEALARIADWLGDQAQRQPIILPLHPRTRRALARTALNFSRVCLIDPLGYVDMTRLMCGASAVFTDSGGLQKEAYFHRVPCVTLRSVTEWVETVEAGWNRLWTQPNYREPRREIEEYGSGDASGTIAALLAEKFSAGSV